jgi:hypothetical protein
VFLFFSTLEGNKIRRGKKVKKMACNLICINYELKLVSNYYYIFFISIENRLNLLFFVTNTIHLMLSVSFNLFMFYSCFIVR